MRFYFTQLLGLVFLSGKWRGWKQNPVLRVIAVRHKTFLNLLKPEHKAEMDPVNIPGGTRAVSESLCRDGRRNVRVRTRETTSRHLYNPFSMHPKYRHGNGRCKHTHTRHYKQGAPLDLLWDERWGSRDRRQHPNTGLPTHANGHDIPSTTALVQAGTNISLGFFFF